VPTNGELIATCKRTGSTGPIRTVKSAKPAVPRNDAFGDRKGKKKERGSKGEGKVKWYSSPFDPKKELVYVGASRENKEGPQCAGQHPSDAERPGGTEKKGPGCQGRIAKETLEEKRGKKRVPCGGWVAAQGGRRGLLKGKRD